jgi:hypothetical protein
LWDEPASLPVTGSMKHLLDRLQVEWILYHGEETKEMKTGCHESPTLFMTDFD